MISGSCALVLQGGGTRGIFVAGVTDAFADAGLLFPYVAGTSAGCLIGYNVISGDRGRAKRVIIEGMQGKAFGSYSNFVHKGAYFDFRYLFEELNEIIPFNREAFDASKCVFYCGCTGVNDGLAHYFEKSAPNFDQCATASSSLPFVGKPVKLEDGLYMDGGTVCPIPFRKPLEDGVDKMVIVFTRTRDYRKEEKVKGPKKTAYKAKYGKYPKYLAALLDANRLYNQDMEEMFELERQGRAYLIFPENPLIVGRMEKNAGKLETCYQEGYEAGKSSVNAIKAFLGISE